MEVNESELRKSIRKMLREKGMQTQIDDYNPNKTGEFSIHTEVPELSLNLLLKGYWKHGMVWGFANSPSVTKEGRDNLIKKLEEFTGAKAHKATTDNRKSEYILVSPISAGVVWINTTRKRRLNKEEYSYHIIARVFGFPEFKSTVENICQETARKHADYKWSIDVTDTYWDTKNNRFESIIKNYTEKDFADTVSNLYTGINVDKLMSDYFKSEENILLLLGEPGTGKTQLIKKAIHDMAEYRNDDLQIVYCKDVRVLKDGYYWSWMNSFEPDILVLDDLDNELQARSNESQEETSTTSYILSFSNGVFPTSTKLIITSNAPNQSIDKALLRPGRCMDAIKLKPMSRDKALENWTSMGMEEDTFHSIFEDQEIITQANFMTWCKRIKRNRNKGYLEDPSLSVCDELAEEEETGKLGFI